MATVSERTNWTRSQLLVALNLYHKVSFGMFHAKNKMLVAISEHMLWLREIPGFCQNGASLLLESYSSFDRFLNRAILALRLREWRCIDAERFRLARRLSSALS